MELLNAVLGICLGAALGRTVLTTPGLILASYLGGTGLLGYAVTAMLYKVGRDYLEICDDGEFVPIGDVKRAIEAKAGFLLSGIFIAGVLANIGWQGLGAFGSIALTLAAVVWTFGFEGSFLITFALVVLFSTCSKYIGVGNAPVMALMFLSSLKSRRDLSRLQMAQDLEMPIANPIAWINGIAVGIVPGLGSGLLVRSNVTAWSVIAIGEGIAIGTNLLLKSSGKSALGAMLSQFSPSLDVTLGLVTIGIAVIWSAGAWCSTTWALQIIDLPDWAIGLFNTAAFAWLLAIPDQPALTWAIAAMVSLAQLGLNKLSVLLPARFTSGLAAAPLMTL